MSPRQKRIGRPSLRTARLVLRPLGPRHAGEIYELIAGNRAWLRRWLPFPDRTRSPRDTLGFIDRMTRSDENIVWGLWVERPEGCGARHPAALCGSIGLHRLDREQGTATLGYWLGRAAGGQGFATEGSAAVLLWAFDSLGLERITVEAATGNAPSLRVIAKLGFVREGRMRKAQRVPGRRRRVDWLVHGLVRSDLRSVRRRLVQYCGTPKPWVPRERSS